MCFIQKIFIIYIYIYKNFIYTMKNISMEKGT